MVADVNAALCTIPTSSITKTKELKNTIATVVLGAHGSENLDAGRAPSGGAKLKAKIREA